MLKSPDVAKVLTDAGFTVVANSPEEFAAHIRAEIASLAKVLRDLKVTAN